MAVENWNTTASLNTTLEGVPVGENQMAPRDNNDLFRAMAAAIRVFYNKALRMGDNVIVIPTGTALPTGLADNTIVIEYTP